MIARVIRGWFTGPDNVDYEMGRLLWFLGVIAQIGYQGYAIYQGQTFNALEFGGGLAATLALGGYGVAVKDRAKAEAAE